MASSDTNSSGLQHQDTIGVGKRQVSDSLWAAFTPCLCWGGGTVPCIVLPPISLLGRAKVSPGFATAPMWPAGAWHTLSAHLTHHLRLSCQEKPRTNGQVFHYESLLFVGRIMGGVGRSPLVQLCPTSPG